MTKGPIRYMWKKLLLFLLAAVPAFLLWEMWQRYGDTLSGAARSAPEEKMYVQTDQEMAEPEIVLHSRRVRQGEKVCVDSLVMVEGGTSDLTLFFRCNGKKLEQGEQMDTSVPGVYSVSVTAGIRSTGRKIKRTAVLLVDGRA